MKPYTMNILSGIDRLRQVISQFAFICPRDENMKLQLSINYPKWHLHTSMLVASQGAGLDIFFATGDMMLSETEPQDKALVMQLRKILNNTVQVVLMNTASSKIVMKYHSRTASGFGLLQMIRHGFSQITSRQLFSMFNTAFDAAVNKSPDENTLTLLNDICAHFNNSKDSAQIMGLFYLRMFNSEQAYARVLDVTNPNISLSSIENTLQDLVPTTHGSAIPATSNKSSANGLKCYKCRKRGHVTRDCPAADGKTAGNTVALVNSSPNSTSGISWAMFNSKEGSGIPSPSYILDSGATLHISNTRAQSGTFTFSHVAVHYISFSDDEASKIATACSPSLYKFDYVPIIGDLFTVPGVTNHAALGHPSPAVVRRLGFPSGPTLVECSQVKLLPLIHGRRTLLTINKFRYSVTAITVRFHRADPGSTPGIGTFMPG